MSTQTKTHKRLPKITLSHRKTESWSPYVLAGPALFFLALFLGYPMIRGFMLSFTETSLLAPQNSTFIGLANFTKLIAEPSTWNAIWITVIYAAGSVIGALVIGLFAALIMNMPLKGRGLIRSVVTLPWAVPPVAVALIFVWMFNNQYGVINFLLNRTGFSSLYFHWLDNPNLALVALYMVTIWMTFPISALILLAALQSVPTELYEASRVDGAGLFNRFRYVTYPGIKPRLYVLALFLTIWALRRFDIIWVLTGGGPVGKTSTIVVQLYREAFENQNLGFASALGSIGLVLSMIVTIIYFRVNRRVEAAEGGTP